MWRSVFLHEFIDHRISNLHALPGRLTLPSLTLVPSAAVVAGTNSVEVTRGKGLEYMFDEPLRDVIGSVAACGSRIRFPITVLDICRGFRF